MRRSPIRVLHVDDDASLLDLTGEFLEREDDRFTIETATSAEDGLDQIGDRPPDCIVSDYDMPGKNGIEFLQTVRETHPDLPFILFTGKGSESVASDAIAAGVTDYLQKGSGTEQYELLANRITNGVQSERATQEATRQAELMRLTEFAGDTGGWELDLETDELMLTDGTRRLMDLPQDDSIGLEDGIELYHPADRDDVRAALDQAAETGEQVQGRWRVRPNEGEQRLLDVTVTPVRSNGDITTLRGAVNDATERYERRQELEQIETLFRYAQDSLFLLNADEGFTTERVNPAYEEVMGLSAEQVCGRSLRDILGARAGAVAENQCRECVERRESLEIERTLRRDGEQTHYVTRIAPVVIDGDVEYIAGSTRDVTEKRDRQRELRLLQQAIDDANVAITLADPSEEDTPLVYVNDAYEELTGYSEEEALGRNCLFLQGDDTDPGKVAALREAVDDEEPVTLELRNDRKDGTEFWNRVTVTPVYDDGELVRYLGTQEDVTARKEREAELARTRDLMSNMEQLADVGAWEYDPSAEQQTTTAGTCRIYGVSPEADLTLEEGFELFHPDDRARLRARFENCLETGKPYEMDVKAGAPDDEQRWLTVRGERVQGTDSESVVRGYLQDITDDKIREQQLTDLNETAQGLSRAHSRQEIAEIGAKAAREILGFRANALHFTTEDRTGLVPAAQTEESVSLIGDAPTLPVEDSIAGRVYRDSEPAAIENVRQDPDAYEPDTGLRGHLYLPLGDHGVLVAGSSEVGAFDDMDITVGELLAENLVAALDRIDQAEKAQQRRDQLSLFFEESPLGAIQWDETFRFDRLNERAQEILGYSEAELRGESWERILADGDHDQIGNAVERLREADGGTHVINETISRTGEVRTCEWHNRAVTDSDGEMRSIFSKFHDVTERERRKQQLEEYETVLETLSDAVYVLDEDGQFTYINDEFVELVGYDRETIIGNTPSLIKDEVAVETAERELGRLLSEGRPETVTFEVTIQPHDGDPIVCEDHMSVLPYAGDTFDGSVGALRDVTERKQRTRKLERQNDRLEEFAGVVSHDLRNPLRTAEGRLKLAQADCDSAHLDDVAGALDRMDALIEDLLTLARGGETVGSTEAVSLSSLIQECWEVVPGEDATLVVETDRILSADRSRLRQLLENLFANAVEHGGEDVTVRVDDIAEGFCVADDGVGIPEEARDSVFAAGYSTGKNGTGFGLRIAKQIVDAHDWEIAVVESHTGGARFEITGADISE